jgi:hypothetical protein
MPPERQERTLTRLAFFPGARQRRELNDLPDGPARRACEQQYIITPINSEKSRDSSHVLRVN